MDVDKRVKIGSDSYAVVDRINILKENQEDEDELEDIRKESKDQREKYLERSCHSGNGGGITNRRRSKTLHSNFSSNSRSEYYDNMLQERGIVDSGATRSSFGQNMIDLY